MKLTHQLLVVALGLYSLGGIAVSAPSVLSRYRVTPRTSAIMDKIAEKFEVTRRDGKSFEVLVPKNLASELKALEPASKLLEEDTSARLRNWDDRGYHNTTTVREHLERIASTYPTIAKVIEYGKSKEGRPLLALKLSDNVDVDEAEPELMLTSATHGDELITVEVLFGILDSIVEGYANKSARQTKMVEDHELFFIPVINADGYAAQTRYANGVDPNRDYPWPEKPSRNPNPCIQSVMNFFHSHDIKGSMDFHAFGRLIMYPWAYTYSPVDSADEKVFDDITGKMADFNNYTFGPISKVIYVAKGSSADYYYWKNKTLALGIEVGTSSAPPSSMIPKVLNEMLEATYTFIEHF